MTLPCHAREDSRILDIRAQTTSAGISFFLIEDHSLPIITIDFAFRGAGSVHDPVGKDGLGQLASNTMDEGAGARNADEFQTALQDRAIELSFSNGRDHFTGKLKTLIKHKDVAVELLRDALTSPRFEDEAVTRMRNANISRVKSAASNPEWMAARLANDVYFGKHPYARNSGGTLSGLAAVTADDLHAFVKEELTRDRLVIAMAGDVTAEQGAQMVDAIFAFLPQKKRVNQDIEILTPPSEAVKAAFVADSPQSVVQMIWPSFPKSDPDYYALRVLDHMLGGGGFSSALMEDIREKQGLTYGIYSRLVHMDYADYLSIESATAPESIAPMTAAVAKVIDGFVTNPVDGQKLDDAKNYLIGSLPLKFSSTQSLSRTAMALSLDDLPMDYLDHWEAKIGEVTAVDIQRVAARIFTTPTPRVTVVAGAVPEDAKDFTMIETLPGVE